MSSQRRYYASSRERFDVPVTEFQRTMRPLPAKGSNSNEKQKTFVLPGPCRHTSALDCASSWGERKRELWTGQDKSALLEEPVYNPQGLAEPLLSRGSLEICSDTTRPTPSQSPSAASRH